VDEGDSQQLAPILMLPDREKCPTCPDGTRDVMIDGIVFERLFNQNRYHSFGCRREGDSAAVDSAHVVRTLMRSAGVRAELCCEQTSKGLTLVPVRSGCRPRQARGGPPILSREQSRALGKSSRGRWNVGFVARRQDPKHVVLLVTLEKEKKKKNLQRFSPSTL